MSSNAVPQLDASKRTGAEREIEPPTHCPSCEQPLTEQGNSRELYCTNVACPAQTVRRLIHDGRRPGVSTLGAHPSSILNSHSIRSPAWR